jgi:hypothetical protein
VLGSERLTGAVLDRLTHRVSVLTMNGDSYRLRQSAGRHPTVTASGAEQNQATDNPETGEIATGRSGSTISQTIAGKRPFLIQGRNRQNSSRCIKRRLKAVDITIESCASICVDNLRVVRNCQIRHKNTAG